MNVTQADLVSAAKENGIPEDQALAIWRVLVSRSADKPSLQSAHIAYYFGALIIAGAMGWFISKAFDLLSGVELCLIALLYQVLALGAATWLGRREDLRVLSGVCATLAVCMTPLAVFGIEKAYNFWPSGQSGLYSDFHPMIRASWVYMEAATVIIGLLILRVFAFPFITAPISYALWYMSMDMSALLFHSVWKFRENCLISIAFGSMMVIISFAIDRTAKKPYAFWGYLFGMLTLWGGLSLLDSGNQVAKLMYALLNAGFVLISVLLNRKVFLVFGAFGIFGYLTTLAHTIFRDSLLFPFALSAIGVAVIAIGFLLQKNIPHIKQSLDRYAFLRALSTR